MNTHWEERRGRFIVEHCSSSSSSSGDESIDGAVQSIGNRDEVEKRTVCEDQVSKYVESSEITRAQVLSVSGSADYVKWPQFQLDNETAVPIPIQPLIVRGSAYGSDGADSSALSITRRALSTLLSSNGRKKAVDFDCTYLLAPKFCRHHEHDPVVGAR